MIHELISNPVISGPSSVSEESPEAGRSEIRQESEGSAAPAAMEAKALNHPPRDKSMSGRRVIRNK